MKRRSTLALIASPALALALPSPATGRNSADPTAPASRPDATIPAKPKIDWSAPLPGRGLASPIVVGDKVFVTCSSGPQQERLHLICFNADDGAKVWERQLRATGRTMSHPKTAIAACTPCSDGRRVFALWSCNDVAAFDLDGQSALDARAHRGLPEREQQPRHGVVADRHRRDARDDDRERQRELRARARCEDRAQPVEARSSQSRELDAAPSRGAPMRNAAPVAVLQSSKGLLAVDPASGSRLWEYTEGASTMSSSVVAGGSDLRAFERHHRARPEDERRRARRSSGASKQINPSTISPLVLGGRALQHQQRGRAHHRGHEDRRHRMETAPHRPIQRFARRRGRSLARGE